MDSINLNIKIRYLIPG